MDLVLKLLLLFLLCKVPLEVHGVTSGCNQTNVSLQICQGTNKYISSYPYTYPDEALPVNLTLTFLKLVDFDSSLKTVTVFVTLASRWNDTRYSTNFHSDIPKKAKKSGASV